MKYLLRHITRYLGVLSLIMLLAACSDKSPLAEDVDEGIGKDKAILILNTGFIGSRAEGDIVSAEENMKSLRIIILHKENGTDWTTECNEHMDFGTGRTEYTRLIPVKRNEDKKIYLIANEESLDAGTDLSALGTDPVSTLEGITFVAKPADPAGNPEFKNGIPMSACYKLHVGEEPRIEKTFWLVRAMTKFTFTFQNGRTDGPVTVNEMRVSSFADKTYLIPQLYKDGGTAVPSEDFTVVDKKKGVTDQNGVTRLDPVWKDGIFNGTYSSEEGATFWIDWLKNAIDYSQNEEIEYAADTIGWISLYSVPADIKYDEKETGIELKGGFEVNLSAEGYQYPQAFYRCESGNDRTYQIDYLKVTDGSKVTKEWTAGETAALRLPNVRYLFRHTHVKVNVIFNQKDVVIFARIHPWKRSNPTDPRPFEPVN